MVMRTNLYSWAYALRCLSQIPEDNDVAISYHLLAHYCEFYIIRIQLKIVFHQSRFKMMYYCSISFGSDCSPNFGRIDATRYRYVRWHLMALAPYGAFFIRIKEVFWPVMVPVAASRTEVTRTMSPTCKRRNSTTIVPEDSLCPFLLRT